MRRPTAKRQKVLLTANHMCSKVTVARTHFAPFQRVRIELAAPFVTASQRWEADSNDTIDFAKNHTMHYREAG